MRALTILVTLVVTLSLSALALAEWSTPLPVTELNTSIRDWQPYLSYDGLSMYFTRNVSGRHRVFEATRDQPSGPFTEITEVFSTSGYDVMAPCVSSDNLRMYYFQESPATARLMFTERASVVDPWPQGTPIAELNTLGSWVQTPRLTEDQLTIFFSGYNLSGGAGSYDLYTATRPDMNSPFTDVRNLAEINTTVTDYAPAISLDGLTFYWGSDRGGARQVWRATRDSLDEVFGNIEHLSFLDTPGGHADHVAVSSDGEAIYIVKALGGDPGNIYVSYIPEPATAALLGLGALLLRKTRKSRM